MGGSSSKPMLPGFQFLDPSQGTYSGQYVTQLDAYNRRVQEDAARALKGTWSWGYMLAGSLVGAIALILFYDLLARSFCWRTVFLPGRCAFTNMTEGMTNLPLNMTTTNSPTNPTPAPLRSTPIPGPRGPTGPTGPTGPAGTSVLGADGTPATFSKPIPPPLFWSWWYGGGTMRGPTDGTLGSTIPAQYSTLTPTKSSTYGLQWWMYVKDWNYGYGREKPVLQRSDTSDPNVMNPSVSLHPTDNVLRIKVSIFPSSESAVSVATPAPANDPGSAQDVFVCEVPNIPLQSWFSVSMTVFERNLDVYIDGMLVKSCFMHGVPKPVAGDVRISPDGGFSGVVCDVNTTNKMLNPADAMSFYEYGTQCRSTVDTGSNASTILKDATGYLVKFGVYDAGGKQIKEYTF